LRWRAERASALVLFASLVLVEGVGRGFRSDLGDAAALAFIALVVGWCAMLHSRAALVWVSALTRALSRAGSFVRSRWFDIGVDLRREPPIPRGVPRILLGSLAGLTGSALLVLAWIVFAGTPLRTLVAPLFYLGWIGCVALLWAALALAIVLMLFLPPAYIHDHMVANWTRATPRSRSREFLLIGAYFVSVLVAGVALPVWVAVALIGLALLVAVTYVWIPPQRRLNLVWRDRRTEQIRAMEWNPFLTLLGPLFVLPFLLAILLSVGPLALGISRSATAMPITAFLGHVAAWLSAWGLCVLAGVWAYHAHVLRRNDPESPAPTRLHITGAEREGDLERVERVLRQRHWRALLHPAPPDPTDVQIELVDHARAPGADRGAALRVSRTALDIPEFHDVLARRDIEQKRRILLEVLETILKRAERRRFSSGTGFWIAPQYWWFSAVTRDHYEENEHGEDETLISEVIPPYYHRALPRPARHHMHQVCRSLGVDLIFLEDGVGFRGLELVMRRMFDRYDRLEGSRLVEESDFTGLPRIRVILHDYEMERPLRREKYPEPDYEDLGRARILHIFKDRDEPPEDWTLPFDLDSLLQPAGVG
jgi:hypothetical protein